MKKLFLLGALALFGAMNAQTKFGLNAGYLGGYAKAKTPTETMTDSNSGFYFGGFAEFTASEKVKIQPGINYLNIDGSGAMQVPIMAKFYVDPKFNLQLGPQFIFDFSSVPAEFSSYYNKTNFALALGTAYEFTNNFFLEGRYSFQLNDHLKNAPAGYSVKANYLNLGVGYRF